MSTPTFTVPSVSSVIGFLIVISQNSFIKYQNLIRICHQLSVQFNFLRLYICPKISVQLNSSSLKVVGLGHFGLRTCGTCRFRKSATPPWISQGFLIQFRKTGKRRVCVVSDCACALLSVISCTCTKVSCE